MTTLRDPGPAFPLTSADIDGVIQNFAQQYGRSPTAEELACLVYARKLLVEKTLHSETMEEGALATGSLQANPVRTSLETEPSG